MSDLWQQTCDDKRTIEALEADVAELKRIVEAVAWIGVDFGHGKFELNDRHTKKARQLIERLR